MEKTTDKTLDPDRSSHTVPAAGDEDRVKGTAIDFGEFRVTRYRRENQTILVFAGTAGPALARELERLASQSRGDLGLDLSDLSGLTPALLAVLERVRKKQKGAGRLLFLCDPPSKLIDILNLAGLIDAYSMVDSSSLAAPAAPREGAEPAPPAEPPRPPAGAASEGGRRVEHARKEITFFDRSLKRTEILERGLDSAARCVQKLLPRKPPLVPGYGFAFTYRQSEKVGGDFFDFITLPGGLLGIAVGDMSGRGLEAAILMCLAKKVISIRAQEAGPGGTPREVLSRANNDLRGDLDRTAFITALYGVLDLERGTMRFARAGHERPILFTPGTNEEPRFLPSDGVALGVLAGEGFRGRLQEHLLELPRGSRLLFFTDGLIDSQSPRGQPFSRVRLLDCLRRARPEQSAEELAQAVFEEISRFTGGGPPEDDMTAVVIARD